MDDAVWHEDVRSLREEQESSKTLAGNQGLYNGFLAAGLAWSIVSAPSWCSRCACSSSAASWSQVSMAVRRSKKILFVQAMPAALGMAVTFLAVQRVADAAPDASIATCVDAK